jgi:K(+)-stimulated pyrophosphate-energized sodium pump
MELQLLLVIAAGLLAVVYGVVQTAALMRASPGTARMQEIAAAIQEGASAYLRRQYTTIAIVGVVILILVAVLLGIESAVGFLIGAVLSGFAGYAGMLISVRANVRTAQAASESLDKGLSMAFRSGAVTGMFVAGFALIGVAGYYMILTRVLGHESTSREVVDALVALGFGASLISIFARLGGGIFTKGADVGGDMVGKVEAGIPEDDPRNPATIADNVGDNVGDCAGMAADLFETYAVTTVATMVLAAILFRTLGTAVVETFMLLPLAICAVCIVTSIIGTFFVRLGKSRKIMAALYQGLIVTGVLSAIAVYLVINALVPEPIVLTGMEGGVATSTVIDATSLFICGLVGLGVTALIVVITEYYTGTAFRPVRSVAQASVSGHGTNVIQGLAVSLESTALPSLVIIAGILTSYLLAGLFGVAIAVTTMLALAGMIVALDAFGPVTDNAGGIAEMAGLPSEVRVSTDALDAVGNTTKAVTKGYAIGSAGLGALVLFAAYTQDLAYFSLPENAGAYPFFAGMSEVRFDLSNPFVIVPLWRHLDDRRGPGRGRGRRGGAPPVPGDPGHHGVQGQARLRQGRGHPDQGGDPGDDRAVAAAGAFPHRALPRYPCLGRPGNGVRLPRRHADRGDRDRPVRGHLDDLGRRRLGQRQEVHRGGQLRRQGLRRPQGGGHRGHRRRSLQGHRGPGREPDDQDHQHRRPAAPGGAGQGRGGLTARHR